MCKKLFVILCIGIINIGANADDAAINFMLMNNYNVRHNKDLWARMRSGFRLNPEETQRVKYYEKLYTKNPSHFNKLMKNASPYLYFVLTEAERYGLPSELALIPIVESNYDSFVANSTGRYDGIWQFIPSTGRDFGLYEDGNINDRRNIVKATNAAMLYFNYLNLVFRQWDVAIGAYNWGPGAMYKAMVASNQKVGEAKYSTLPLREITANYVPKLIALANIIRNPSKFGVKLIDIPNQPYFAITYPKYSISVADMSSVSQTDNQTFKILNPQFKNSSYSLNQQSQVLLPVQKQSIYLASVNGNTGTANNSSVMLASAASSTPSTNSSATLADKNITNQALSPDNINGKVIPVSYSNDNNVMADDPDADTDDAISQIAYNSNNNSDSIKAATNTAVSQTANKTVLIVARNSTTQDTKLSQKANNANEQLVDNLVDNLGEQSHHGNKALVAHNGSKLSSKHVKYKVNKGDTLFSISQKFDVAVEQIKKANRLHSNSVKIGQLLTIKAL